MTKLADSLAELAEIERDLPVHRWMVDGIQIWPLFKVRIGHAIAWSVEGLPAPTSDVGISASVARARSAARGAAQSFRAPRRSSAQVARGSPVFLSDGVSYVKLFGQTVDRFCDPLRDELRESGLEPLLLVPGYGLESLPMPVCRIQRQLDLDMLAARLRRSRSIQLPAYEDIARRLRSIGLETGIPSQATIAVGARVIETWARRLALHLRKAEAVAGLVVEFYSLRGMAFVLACRFAGVPSVDLQHGLQGALHFAYGSWRPPEPGYPLLPDRFAVWTSAEADVIAQWGGSHHRPVVVGNPFLDRWLVDSPGTVAADREVRAMSPEGRGCPTILWTLGGLETADQRRELAHLLAESPPTWRWWIRCHPTRPDIETWDRELSGAAPGRANVRDASSMPLYALLRHASAHGTRGSSAVHEATRFGVPSVVVGDAGTAIYSAEITSNEVLGVPKWGNRQITDALTSALERPRSLAARQPDGTWRSWIRELAEDPWAA